MPDPDFHLPLLDPVEEAASLICSLTGLTPVPTYRSLVFHRSIKAPALIDKARQIMARLPLDATQIWNIAAIFHEAQRKWALLTGEPPPPPWAEAAMEQKQVAIDGVTFLVDHPDATIEDCHNAWMRQRLADGWTFGRKLDPDAKKHPDIRPFETMGQTQKQKDLLFYAVVKACIATVKGGSI